MRYTHGFAAVFAGVALAACASEPQPAAMPIDAAGSPARGLIYARETCANCHAVEPGDMLSPNPAAPPFESVANTPGMTGLALRVWLQSPHPSMPNLIVEPDRQDDLSSYIASLANE